MRVGLHGLSFFPGHCAHVMAASSMHTAEACVLAPAWMYAPNKYNGLLWTAAVTS